MEFKDLVELYEKKKQKFGSKTYEHISELLDEAKVIHKKDWLKNPTPKMDHEQSWKGFKGRSLEKLIIHIIKDEVESLGLKIVQGDVLERTKSSNLSEELNRVKRNLLVDFGVFGAHMPDADGIIYNPKTCEVIAIFSSKTTLRERIAQTGYWKIKLSRDDVTKHIKVFFFTPDEDTTLSKKEPTKKGRAIVEVDTDGGYVMSEEDVEESDKVKKFDKFISDLNVLLQDKKIQ